MTDQKFPEPEPNDVDEVVLALKTGGSLWTSGDKVEAIRWLRKAQEAAEAGGDDMRSITLARAAADLTELAELRSGETQAAGADDGRPQLTKPPMPPPNPKTRLETPRAKSQNGKGSQAPASEVSSKPAVVEEGPILTQALRVCVKRSLRDDELFVARLLEDGEVPAGYHEALVVLTDPTQDLLDKLS